MELRERIEKTFDGKGLDDALFYNYSGGIRFELSESGSYIQMFNTASQKANEICRAVFAGETEISVCLKFFGGINLLSSLSIFRELRELDISLPIEKQHWSEKDEEDDNCAWHYVAFNAPVESLSSLLWCACVVDFGHIKPNPGASVYLFNFHKQIIVHPYDDRGMDVLGNNPAFLKSIYSEFTTYLLEYDKKTMEQTFG